MTARAHSARGQHILVDPDFSPECSARLFEPTFWPQAKSIKDGRGAGWFIDTPSGRAVLKHYRRGGLIAKISDDRYLFTGWPNVRALAEYQLLSELRSKGLAVPQPLAAMGKRHGLLYRCALITAWIDHRETLSDRLRREGSAPDALWQSVGESIARLAGHQVDHVDFNPDNLLLGNNDTLHIIDFDNAGRRQHDGSQQVSRLLRGIAKRLQLESSNEWLGQVEREIKKGAGLI